MPNPARELALQVEGYKSYVADLGFERAERALRYAVDPERAEEIIDAWTARQHQHRPSDDPELGNRCKDCRQAIVWIGPGADDWAVADEHHKQRLVALAESLRLASDDLFAAVHDLASKRASDINNCGLDDQIAFLLRHLSVNEVEREIRDAAQSVEAV